MCQQPRRLIAHQYAIDVTGDFNLLLYWADFSKFTYSYTIPYIPNLKEISSYFHKIWHHLSIKLGTIPIKFEEKHDSQ